MMLQVLAYASAIAAALCAVGVGLERLAAQRRWSRRIVWAAVMVLTILFPLQAVWRADPAEPAVASLSLLPAAEIQPVQAISSLPVGLETDSVSAHSAAATSADAKRTWKLPVPSDRTVFMAWVMMSLTLLLGLAMAQLLLHRRVAEWERTDVLGEPVFVSESLGPALFGALQPRIVVPRWFLETPAATQALILAHEQQHQEARDPLLLWAGFLAVVLTPWNLPLWWQLRRLRLAIELDCDSRVLRAGADACLYGEVLLAVTRANAVPVGVVAMGETASLLERRIRSLVPAANRFAGLRMVGAAGIALAGVAVTFALDAPSIAAVTAGNKIIQAPVLEMLKSRDLDQGAVNDRAVEALAVAAPHRVAEPAGQMLPPGRRLKSPLLPVYYDGWRSQQHLQNIVRRNHADHLLPASGRELNRLTLFLTEDGKVERERLERLDKDVNPLGGPAQAEALAANIASTLALDAERIGAVGLTVVTAADAFAGSEQRILFVMYAWPRRQGESAPSMLTERGAAPADSFDVDAALRIVEDHIPDAFRASRETAGNPVIVLSPAGDVLRAGRVKVPGDASSSLLQDPVLLGIRTSQVARRSIRNAAGERADVIFAWKAPDVP